jgi:hypothetical protein
MLRIVKGWARELAPLFSRKAYRARPPLKNRFTRQFEYRYLRNGRYRGVIVWSLIGRFSDDDVERFCEHERETKEQALNDARTAIWN